MKRFLMAALLLASVQSFAQDYTFVFLNKRTDKAELPKEEVDEIMEGHLANIERLAKEGKLIAAGPFDGGGGIFIFNSKSVDETREWLSTDPGVKAERWHIEILPYLPRKGGVCTVGEEYEMVTYSFVRFIPSPLISSSKAAPKILKKHFKYLYGLEKDHTIVTEGIFGSYDGGILVVNGDISEQVLKNDPIVKKELMTFDAKKLWIAKGSFCEK